MCVCVWYDAISSLPSRTRVFNIFRYKVMGRKDIFVSHQRGFRNDRGVRRADLRSVPRNRTCHNEGMNLMNDYRDAAFLLDYPRESEDESTPPLRRLSNFFLPVRIFHRLSAPCRITVRVNIIIQTLTHTHVKTNILQRVSTA